MRELRTQVIMGTVDKLVGLVLLEMNFIEKVIRSVHPAERKIGLHHYSPVSVLMVQKASSTGENDKSDNHQVMEEGLALFTAPLWVSLRISRLPNK